METLKEQRRRAAKPLLWIGIAGMAMMFAGMTSGYVVSRSALVQDERWMTFGLPNMFVISTVLAALTSVILFLSVKQYKKANLSAGRNLVILGFISSIAFVVFQLLGWKELYDNGVFFTGPGSNTAGSWIYAITFLHLLHVVGGMVASLITIIKAYLSKYNEQDYLGIELNAIYWHFVDVLWIYLFIFLSLFR